MAHSYSNLLVHLVFSTKNRRPDLRPELKHKTSYYYAGMVKNGRGWLEAADH